MKTLCGCREEGVQTNLYEALFEKKKKRRLGVYCTIRMLSLPVTIHQTDIKAIRV
jgi:hypothetical protein